jgi:hypothetical protein
LRRSSSCRSSHSCHLREWHMRRITSCLNCTHSASRMFDPGLRLPVEKLASEA